VTADGGRAQSRDAAVNVGRRRIAVSTVVVGVDGSAGSVAALRFAIEEAKLRRADVKAVAAWNIPAAAYDSIWVAGPLEPRALEEAATAALESALAAAGGAASGVNVTPLVRRGHPADVLVAEARDADLLVVGSRGLGGFRGLLLGSVSQQCAHHADCPVVIVPRPHEDEE
jgi:nucleotide-binding universal stress UspA family protein